LNERQALSVDVVTVKMAFGCRQLINKRCEQKENDFGFDQDIVSQFNTIFALFLVTAHHIIESRVYQLSVFKLLHQNGPLALYPFYDLKIAFELIFRVA